MPSQIQRIDYRNSCYLGQIFNKQHHGVGILIDDCFLFCLAQWENNKINGSAFIVFPDQRIFYGKIRNLKQSGVCTYVLGNQCYLYANFNNGKPQKNIVIDFRLLNCVIQFQSPETGKIRSVAQHNYDNQQDKWLIIENCINGIVEQHQKIQINFINKQFSQKYKQKYIDILANNQIFIGFGGQTLGLKINNITGKIISIGYYSNDRTLIGIGLKNIDTIGGTVFQQGDYSQINSLSRYQLPRPKNFTKFLQHYWYRSLYFSNNFFKMDQLTTLWNYCDDINNNLKDMKTQKYAQILLQNPPRGPMIQNYDSGYRKDIYSQRINYQGQPDSRTANSDFLYYNSKINKTPPKKPQDYSLQKIKQQVYLAAQRRKNSRFDSNKLNKDFSPSQLKKTPKKRQSNYKDASLSQYLNKSQRIPQINNYDNSVENITVNSNPTNLYFKNNYNNKNQKTYITPKKNNIYQSQFNQPNNQYINKNGNKYPNIKNQEIENIKNKYKQPRNVSPNLRLNKYSQTYQQILKKQQPKKSERKDKTPNKNLEDSLDQRKNNYSPNRAYQQKNKYNQKPSYSPNRFVAHYSNLDQYKKHYTPLQIQAKQKQKQKNKAPIKNSPIDKYFKQTKIDQDKSKSPTRKKIQGGLKTQTKYRDIYEKKINKNYQEQLPKSNKYDNQFNNYQNQQEQYSRQQQQAYKKINTTNNQDRKIRKLSPTIYNMGKNNQYTQNIGTFRPRKVFKYTSD